MFYIFWRMPQPALFPPQAGQESLISAKTREILVEIYAFRKFLYSKTEDYAPKCQFVS